MDEAETRGVGFRAVNAAIDTTTPMGRAFLQIQATFAEMERNVVRQRVKEGVAAARARGRRGGRPRLMTPERLRYAQHLMADREHSVPSICRELGGVPASTLYHYLHAGGTLKAPGVRLLGAWLQPEAFSGTAWQRKERRVAATLLDRLLTTLAGQLHAFSVCEVQDGWRLAFPPFDAVIIHCVLKGSGSLRVGNGPWRPFVPGSIIVVPPRRAHALGEPGAVARESRGEEHCSLLGDGLVAFTAGDGSRDTLMACGTIATPRGSVLGLFDLLRGPLVEDLSSSGVHRQVFDLMLAEVASPSLGMQAMTEALMRQCLILLLRRHLPRDDDVGSPLFAAIQHPRLARAVVAVLENPAAPHSVESLASLAGMSRASFAEHFSQAFQQGPIEFVQKARLGIAARLLATTDLPVKVIAGSIGYASRSYFSRAFRAAYGTDPSTFRDGGGAAKDESGAAQASLSPDAGVWQATEPAKLRSDLREAAAPRHRVLVSEEGALSSSTAETAKPGDS